MIFCQKHVEALVIETCLKSLHHRDLSLLQHNRDLSLLQWHRDISLLRSHRDLWLRSRRVFEKKKIIRRNSNPAPGQQQFESES